MYWLRLSDKRMLTTPNVVVPLLICHAALKRMTECYWLSLAIRPGKGGPVTITLVSERVKPRSQNGGKLVSLQPPPTHCGESWAMVSYCPEVHFTLGLAWLLVLAMHETATTRQHTGHENMKHEKISHPANFVVLYCCA